MITEQELANLICERIEPAIVNQKEIQGSQFNFRLKDPKLSNLPATVCGLLKIHFKGKGFDDVRLEFEESTPIISLVSSPTKVTYHMTIGV